MNVLDKSWGCMMVDGWWGLGLAHDTYTRRELDLFVLRPFIFSHLYNLALLHPTPTPTPWWRWNFEEKRNEWERITVTPKGHCTKKVYGVKNNIKKSIKRDYRVQLYECGPPFDGSTPCVFNRVFVSSCAKGHQSTPDVNCLFAHLMQHPQGVSCARGWTDGN